MQYATWNAMSTYERDLVVVQKVLGYRVLDGELSLLSFPVVTADGQSQQGDSWYVGLKFEGGEWRRAFANQFEDALCIAALNAIDTVQSQT